MGSVKVDCKVHYPLRNPPSLAAAAALSPNNA